MRLAALLVLLLSAPALACGPDSDCLLPDGRTYRLSPPPGAAAPAGLLLFAHGYRGSAAAEMANAALRRTAADLGLALVALKSAGEDWDLAHRPRDPAQEVERESAYVAAVLDDVAGRIAVDPGRVVAAGFSAGGMLTWTLACSPVAERFAGFVPLSGTFWAPVPADCPAPARNLVHIHGTADRVVPVEGRRIGGTRQGKVPAALALYAAAGGFGPPGPPLPAPEGMTCETRTNPAGRLLADCRFAGGHDFSAARLRHGVAAVLGSPAP
jgi:polyhydroxybutyrate depolymerase